MNIIQELKQKPLVDFFETHLNISLIKSGNKYCCLCPIHNDSNPSFYIDPKKNKCSCFGSCGLINGDIIDFTSKYKSFSVNESIHWLANKYNIQYQLNKKAISEKNENNLYFEICNFAANYYHSNLYSKKPYTKLGVLYLQSRKLTKSIVKDFKIGYAPATSEIGTWTYLTDSLKKEGFDLDLCEKIGIIRKSKQNSYYDSFFGRIILPIFDLQDRCIGFNSRILPEYQSIEVPKYLLSKENSIFKKNNFIYGLNNSLKHIRQQDLCYIVEGCFDSYKMNFYDYKNTIPLLGGKLFKNLQKNKNGEFYNFTEHFCGLPNVSTYVFLMDPDKAGIKYAIENGAELIKHEKSVLICELKKDPDDSSKEEIDLAIKNAVPYLDFYLKHNFKYHTNEHKLQILDKLCMILNGISKEQVLLYAKQLSIKMEIPLGLILFRFGLENKLQYEEIFIEMMKYIDNNKIKIN